MRTIHPKWINIPDVVLIEVFKYLSDTERAKAALVCENWSRIFNSPCLWRSRSFELGGYKAQTHGLRACRFAENFGKYLRYMAISCSHPSYHTCKLFQKSIDDFLASLKDAETQLYEFEFCRLELERYWKFDTHREKLISILSKFLKTQKLLQCFDMSSAQFPAFGGCRVLDAIAHQSGSFIQDMILEDFFHSRLAVHLVKKFNKVIGKFSNLKYLSLNYNCLSDEILETFSKSLQGKLHFLNIKVFRNDPHFHRISGLAWKQFSRACPRLRVAVWFESIGMHQEIVPILVKEAPIKDIHIWSGYDDDLDWRLSETIDHITNTYANAIESVSFELDNTQEIVDQPLLHLAAKCKKLKELSINAMISIKTVEDICEMLREKTIDLSMLHVTFCGIGSQLVSEEELDQLRRHYTHILQEIGTEFRLTRFDF
ncbi:F-box only protein 39-like isoform X2 [Ruditapes philippinarum]|uniref:F-box only protein 39-like isoform X2 n=1 Tax=Ruditapes philippinarum TaxID=129788 RepID=UPI00295A667C|nr:F-box only protein 39-like isoform X2 [Ruditapes philippinarum]XP_060582020.1 F-box only protein 39-like isoform X2 [Ruditapes philippinarum]